MDVRAISLKVDEGGASQKVAVSAASAQSAAITISPTGNQDVMVTPDIDVFVRQGSSPIAVADGTDILLLAGNSYRLSGIVNGNKLAFITGGGAGFVYISPGA
jgi:hypothetical protein